MIHIKKRHTSFGALVIAGILIVNLTGCQSAMNDLKKFVEDYAPPVTAGQTISSDSKWINSDIQGAINEAINVREQDDFYTAANRSWLLENTATKTNSSINNFTQLTAQLYDRLVGLIHIDPQNTDGLDERIMGPEQLVHTQQIVQEFYHLAADWDTREKQSVSPLLPYLDTIDNIQSLDEMTSYLKNENGMNLGLDFLIPFYVDAPISKGDTYSVFLTSTPLLTLKDSVSYFSLDSEGVALKEMTDSLIRDVLEKGGRSQPEIRKTLKNCYQFEYQLSCYIPSSYDLLDVSYLSENEHVYNREELENLQGNYPLLELLDTYGLGGSKTFTVTEPEQIKNVGNLYTETHLEELKAYYTVHTILSSIQLLSRKYFDDSRMLESVYKKDTPKTEESDPDSSEIDPETALIIQNYIFPYLSPAYQEMYIGHYCNADQKRALLALTDEVLDSFRDILQKEDYLSEETRQKAVEKLDYMGVHVLYPDQLPDYRELNFKKGGSLVDAAASINRFTISHLADMVNQPVNRDLWDLKKIPTIDVNAYYIPTDNSFNILAGIVAADNMFSTDASYEQNLATIGTAIGHEISHGFDSSGYDYDKNGRYENWWSDIDREQFEIRTSRLKKYYSGLTPIPGSTSYNGNNVSGEAIADMGGVKCALNLAASRKNFDYDCFFKSYARLWACKNTYAAEIMSMANSHPLNFLRVNVTLQQFDEFMETYRIQPEDGMYLDKDKRILVW